MEVRLREEEDFDAWKIHAVILLLALAGSAVGQNQPGGTTTSPGSQAPVGHRQPTPGDVTAGPPPADNTQSATERADEARLERALKSICRGC